MNEKHEIFILLIFFGFTLSYFIWIDPIYYLDIKAFLKQTPVFFLPTLILSILGLYFALKNYFRKSGANVSAWYGVSGTNQHSKNYISSVLLLNNKDKPLIINNIYLRLGRNIYIKLSEMDSDFLTLKSYEVMHYKLPAVHVYFSGMIRIENIDKAINDKKITKRIVLDTLEGLVVCKKFKKDSVLEIFFNRLGTGYIHGYGGELINDRALGDRVLYHIEYINIHGYKTFTYISIDKKKPSTIEGLNFDIDLLWSDNGKKHVENVLNNAKELGIIDWQSFEVYSRYFDLTYTQSLIEKSKKKLDICEKRHYHSIFQHYISVPIFSFIERCELKLNNRKLQKKNIKKK